MAGVCIWPQTRPRHTELASALQYRKTGRPSRSRAVEVRSELECPPPRGRPLLLSGWPFFFGASGFLPIWNSAGGFTTNSSLPGFVMIGDQRGGRRVHECHLHYAHARLLVIGQSHQHKFDRAALSSREGKTDIAQKRNAQPVQIRARPPRRGSSRAGLRGNRPISI